MMIEQSIEDRTVLHWTGAFYTQ